MLNNQTGVTERNAWRAPNHGVRTQNYDRFLIGRLLTDTRIRAYELAGRYGTKRKLRVQAQELLKQLQRQTTHKALLKRYDV